MLKDGRAEVGGLIPSAVLRCQREGCEKRARVGIHRGVLVLTSKCGLNRKWRGWRLCYRCWAVALGLAWFWRNSDMGEV